MSPTGKMETLPSWVLTSAETDALKWLTEHNGEGHIGGPGMTLMAGGEVAPHLRSTWNSLEKKGFVEFYHLRKRLRLVSPSPRETEHER